MRKNCLFICLLISLALTGCGKKEEEKTTISEVQTETTTEATTEKATPSEAETTTEEITTEESTLKSANDDVVLSFDKEIIIADDENITVKLVGLFQENVNWSDGELNEKGIILKVTNNGEHTYLMDLEDLYLSDEGVYATMSQGNEGPAPGKTKEYSYYIRRDSKFEKSISTLNELAGLNGKIALDIFTDDGEYIDSDKSYTIDFSLSDYSDDINKIVNEAIDYEIDNSDESNESGTEANAEGNADINKDFDITGTWYSLRNNTLEATAEFNEDGTITWTDGSSCTWKLKPEDNAVYIYYSDYDWGGDYALNEYNGYYLIQYEDITMVRKENYTNYIHSLD